MEMTKTKADELLKLISDVGDEHYLSEYPCDLCGTHTDCDKCGTTSRGHQADVIGEAVAAWLDQLATGPGGLSA